MYIESKAETMSISVSSQELARLGLILEWVKDSRGEMDEGKVMLESDELNSSLKLWSDAIHNVHLSKEK